MAKFGLDNLSSLKMLMAKSDGTWFHTSNSNILPSQSPNGLPDILQGLRPATTKAADSLTLAGDPRMPGPNVLGIESEVYRKWNTKPKTVPRDCWFSLMEKVYVI